MYAHGWIGGKLNGRDCVEMLYSPSISCGGKVKVSFLTAGWQGCKRRTSGGDSITSAERHRSSCDTDGVEKRVADKLRVTFDPLFLTGCLFVEMLSTRFLFFVCVLVPPFFSGSKFMSFLCFYIFLQWEMKGADERNKDDDALDVTNGTSHPKSFLFRPSAFLFFNLYLGWPWMCLLVSYIYIYVSRFVVVVVFLLFCLGSTHQDEIPETSRVAYQSHTTLPSLFYIYFIHISTSPAC